MGAAKHGGEVWKPESARAGRGDAVREKRAGLSGDGAEA